MSFSNSISSSPGMASRGTILVELIVGGLLFLLAALIAMKVLALFFGVALGFAASLFWVVIYFIPTIIARGSSNFITVLLINLIFGGTVIGWIIALIIALKADKPAAGTEIQA